MVKLTKSQARELAGLKTHEYVLVNPGVTPAIHKVLVKLVEMGLATMEERFEGGRMTKFAAINPPKRLTREEFVEELGRRVLNGVVRASEAREMVEAYDAGRHSGCLENLSVDS